MLSQRSRGAVLASDGLCGTVGAIRSRQSRPTRRLRRRCGRFRRSAFRRILRSWSALGRGSTISAQDPASIAAGHGIGAAREWIKSEFERYSKDCGGCLEVKTDSFTEQPAERIPQATEITNVYAV